MGQADGQRHGRSDCALAAAVLGERSELTESWKEDTCRRYLLIADQFDAGNATIMNRWEMTFGRQALVDNLNILRAARPLRHRAIER